MAEVTLSDGLNTREDAEKIVKALWGEAVERDWEDRFRQFAKQFTQMELLPTVGHVERVLSMVPGHDWTGVVGEVLAVVALPSAEVRFRHRVETSGEGGKCCCPDDTHGAQLVLNHAREELRLAGKAMYLGAPPRSLETYMAMCSATECVNA